jgi:hypothetical protein
LVTSRTRGEELIKNGDVLVNGISVEKPGKRIPVDANIILLNEELTWVSRGALKLLKAIETFEVDVKGKSFIDLGASTGGFTEVLLKNEVAKVFCVDGVHFNERKHWLNDDYVKFIRFAQYLVEKNGEGIVAFINPHGYLDNPTFRGMRWNLLKTFDKIYTIDLHGNGKKKETAPDGSVDQNVFDIMQGVSINLFVKTNKKTKNELAKVFHYD